MSRVTISGLEQISPAPMGVPITFSVDAAGAGEGTLELVVSTANNTVKAEVTACARGLYDVTFVPQTAEPHYVNITFNDISIDGNPFRVSLLLRNKLRNFTYCLFQFSATFNKAFRTFKLAIRPLSILSATTTASKLSDPIRRSFHTRQPASERRNSKHLRLELTSFASLIVKRAVSSAQGTLMSSTRRW